METLRQYYELCLHADWDYEYSDDPAAHKKGQAEVARLSKIADQSLAHAAIFGKFRNWGKDGKDPATRPQPPAVTAKEIMFNRVNKLREERGIPLLLWEQAEKHTKDELDIQIHDLEDFYDTKKEEKPATKAQLLKKLNAARALKKKKPYKDWKKPISDLQQELVREQSDRSSAKVQRLPTRIAAGANTSQFAVSKSSPTSKGMIKMQRAEAERIAQVIGHERKHVLKWMKERSVHSEDALIRLWPKTPREQRLTLVKKEVEAAGPTRSKSPTTTTARGPRAPVERDYLTPSDIAALMKRQPRDVRIVLRRIEKDIPSAYRVPSVRWGFKKEHQAAVIKLIGGKK